MNDFTKEELFSLKADILFVRASIGNIDWSECILVKLQSMIDSYCDHVDSEFKGNFYDIDLNLCKKCGEFYR